MNVQFIDVSEQPCKHCLRKDVEDNQCLRSLRTPVPNYVLRPGRGNY